MEINACEITILMKECDEVRRRTASSVDDDNFGKKDLAYIDTQGYVESMESDNNTLIFGRRGCGKTSLLLEVAKRNLYNCSPKLLISTDMQINKTYDADIIVCKIMLKIIKKVLKLVEDEIWDEVSKEFKKQYKGMSGLIKKISKKRNCETKNKFTQCKDFIYFCYKLENKISEIQKMEKAVLYVVKSSSEIIKKDSKTQHSVLEIKGELINENDISVKYKNLATKFELTNTFVKSIKSEKTTTNSKMDSTQSMCEQQIEKRREDILVELKEAILCFVDDFYQITNKKIVLMLDDFYQIELNYQPFVIQYFHDISKICRNKSFRFKIFAIPNRLRLNEKNPDLSYKDDFLPINIDNNIMDINNLKDYLTKMLSGISKSANGDKYLTQKDVYNLFPRYNDDEVLLYLILASGAIPRDFIVMFRDVMQDARSNAQSVIGKENIYNSVRNLRKDKDNNVENDSNLQSDIIDELRKSLELNFVDKFKTNVFLYPIQDAEEKIQERILNNMENLRYIYLISQSVTAELTKEDCRAYMIDMSFCIAGKRLKNNFEMRKYWEKTSKSNVLRQSKVWKFPKETIEMVKKSIISTSTFLK